MKSKLQLLLSLAFVFIGLFSYLGGCSSAKSAQGSGSSSASCSLTENTTETTTENAYGCALLERDTSACESSRTAQGLSGFWLKFSCRVTLTKSGLNVIIETDSQPDHKSQYFDSSDACYESFSASGRFTNPNSIAAQSVQVSVPYSPAAAGSTSAMDGGVVGVAIDGTVIYDNEAAPGDDIYDEAASFDKCEGHPDSRGMFHYHTEPVSISSEDANFIGVMRDGFPIYGRYDSGSSTPTLDSAQGHSGTTVDSGSSIYHYHVKIQTSGSDSAYFITNGLYKGTKGSCSGC
jgi:hypothetical protein